MSILMKIMPILTFLSLALLLSITTNTMYNKFIITMDGTIVFGNVHLHKDLLPYGHNMCHGGGLWKIDNQRGMILLYGRSFDFGAPEFEYARRIDRTTIPGNPDYPVFYQHQWLEEEILDPILL